VQTLAVMITTPPYSNITATAIDYIESALQLGIKVVGVFFYQAGVLNANNFVILPNDEFQALDKWQALHHKYNVPLHLCYSAAEKHGLTDEMLLNNVAPDFTVSGLGELVELSCSADRVVQL
jgi:tRNA 2-thiouridine synthesizing protein D